MISQRKWLLSSITMTFPLDHVHTYRDALSSAKDMKHCDSGISWSTENCFSDSGNGLDALLEVTWLYKATCKNIHIILMFLFIWYHKKSSNCSPCSFYLCWMCCSKQVKQHNRPPFNVLPKPMLNYFNFRFSSVQHSNPLLPK
jgi:hypothetical protein